MKNSEEVLIWSKSYPVEYDDLYYYPYLNKARYFDASAMRKISEWKNPNRAFPPKPMPLAPTKKKPLEYIISRFSDYKSQSDSGSFQLKQDFSNRSPVYAIFWHHVLYGTPILDVHTHRAFLYFTKGKLLPRRKAAIPRKGHWDIHSAYSAWFQKKLLSFQKENQSITDRILDRALFQWGKHNQDFLCPL